MPKWPINTNRYSISNHSEGLLHGYGYGDGAQIRGDREHRCCALLRD